MLSFIISSFFFCTWMWHWLPIALSDLQQGKMMHDKQTSQLLIPVTHRSGCISKVDFEASHSSDDGDDGLDGVAVDHSLVLLTLLLWIPCFMDDPGRQTSQFSLNKKFNESFSSILTFTDMPIQFLLRNIFVWEILFPYWYLILSIR